MARTCTSHAGIAIATCCHHRCDEASYTSSAWLHEMFAREGAAATAERTGGGGARGNGARFGPQDEVPSFDLVRLVTSWAVCTCACKKPKAAAAAAAAAAATTGAVVSQSKSTSSEDAAGVRIDAGGKDAHEGGGGVGHAEASGEEGNFLTVEERERVGRECKRLLDMGRVIWLRKQGLSAELVHFCKPQVSPENCLLIAWPPAA